MGSRSKEFDDSSSNGRAVTPKTTGVSPKGGSIFDQLQKQIPTTVIPIVSPAEIGESPATSLPGVPASNAAVAPSTRAGRRSAGYAPGYPSTPSVPEYPVAPTNIAAPSEIVPENPNGPRVVRVAPEAPAPVALAPTNPFVHPAAAPLTDALIPDATPTGVVESIAQQAIMGESFVPLAPQPPYQGDGYASGANATQDEFVDDYPRVDDEPEITSRRPKARTQVKYRNAVVGPAVSPSKKTGAKRGTARRSGAATVEVNKTAPKKARPIRRTGRTATLVAMAFIAGLAVATSVPANALLTETQVQAISNGSTYSEYEPVQEVQAANSTIASGRDQVSGTSWGGMSGGGLYSSETYVNDPMGTIQWPIRRTVPISDLFGIRQNPFGAGTSFHHGVDFNPGIGAPIQAIADGTVSYMEEADGGGLGYYVIIDHDINGMKFQSVYGHMLAGSIQVHVGQQVHVTDIVGQVGNTGASTGPHLHFEIRIDGAVVDPLAWLRANAN